MVARIEHIIGTSGYSFDDWIGGFYPLGTRRTEMFDYYVTQFRTVELNFTYYRMPTVRTMDKLARTSPEGFDFWVKANQETTHKQNRTVAAEYIENLRPLAEAGKLAGVLLQFPQSFHRTVANRNYLAAAIDDLSAYPLAVEFRHSSWDAPATFAGLSDRGVTLVVPDVPPIRGLFRVCPATTTRTGYLRLHSRDASKWYAGAVERYDYEYTETELGDIADAWSALEGRIDRLYSFFNNCHRAQAAQNAKAFQRIVDQMHTTG